MNLNNPTYLNKHLNMIKAVLVLLIMIAVSYHVEAQRFSRYGRHIKRGPKTNIGFEGSMGTRSFRIKSDISVINKMSLPMEGGSFGAVVGNKYYRVKIKQGYFNSAPSVIEKFKMMETKGILNLYLLQGLNKSPKYFEPYLITAVDRSALKFYGSYVDPSKYNNNNTSGSGNNTSGSGNNSSGSSSGSSQCDGPMGDPDQTGSGTNTGSNTGSTTPDPSTTDSTDPSNKQYLGRVSTMHANVGLGLECHIPGQKHFVNLFAEVQYGVPFGTTTKDIPFNNTKTSGAMSVNFGLSFGISR